jgi:putative hemolysin
MAQKVSSLTLYAPRYRPSLLTFSPPVKVHSFDMEWIIVAICLGLNAVLAAAEIAFVTLTRSQARELVKTGKKSAQILMELRENPERTLSVIQIGISMVGALAAAVGGAQTAGTLSPYLRDNFGLSASTAYALAILALVVPLTFLSVVFGELIPKTLALRNPARIAIACAPWLMRLDTIFLPVVDMLEWCTKRVLTIFFPKSRATQMGTPVDNTVELDTLSSQARQYILNLVSIETKRAREVMLPWNQVDHVYFSQSIDEVEAVSLRSGHTRLPVIAEGQIFGIINTKELLALVKSGSPSWTQIVRPISKVNDSDNLLKSLRQMQEKRSHLSAVYQGSTLVGIVTMEDILEEIIGEVYDEDDDGALRRILSAAGRLKSKH